MVEGVAAEAMVAMAVPLANDGGCCTGWPNDGLEAAPEIEERCITLELEAAAGGGWPAVAARGGIGAEEGGWAGAANPEGFTAVGTAVIC